MSKVAAPFQIIEVLGEGSFGAVCVARITDDPLQRKVALKILKQDYAKNNKVLKRTKDEARLLSKLNHPNIVRVERMVMLNGRPVVVMEWVQGASLDQLLLRFRDGMPTSVALEIVKLTANALYVAFTEPVGKRDEPMCVIHRDIKPSNLLMSIHGELKVVDFGIAKSDFEGREADTNSVVMGSRPYMAPERLDGIPDTPAVDVYSLGMTLYELLAGRPMTLSINPVAHDQAMSRQLGALQSLPLPPQCVAEVQGVIRRMCAYDRDHRPTPEQVVHDIEQVMFLLPEEQWISLEEFARTSVRPIYETRPRVAPSQMREKFPEDELLAEITGTINNDTSVGRIPGRTRLSGEAPEITQNERDLGQPQAQGRDLTWVPFAFVGVLLVVVLLLSVAALAKYLTREVSTVAPVPVLEVPDGQVGVAYWMSGDVEKALLDGNRYDGAGTWWIEPGETTFEVELSDGQHARCSFVATPGGRVMVLRDQGQVAVAVDDQPAQGCSPLD